MAKAYVFIQKWWRLADTSRCAHRRARSASARQINGEIHRRMDGFGSPKMNGIILEDPSKYHQVSPACFFKTHGNAPTENPHARNGRRFARRFGRFAVQLWLFKKRAQIAKLWPHCEMSQVGTGDAMEISWEILWRSYGISMVGLWMFYGLSMDYGCSMEFLWNFYGLWISHGNFYRLWMF